MGEHYGVSFFLTLLINAIVSVFLRVGYFLSLVAPGFMEKMQGFLAPPSVVLSASSKAFCVK